MGLLKNIFRTRESNTHFERDSSGNVTRVTRSGDEPRHGILNPRSRTPISDSLEKEYYKQHPEKKLSSRIIAGGKSFDKRVVSKMKPIDMSYSPRERGRTRYKIKDNYNPFGSMFDSGMSSWSGPTQVRIKKGKGKKVKEMDMFDNWGLMK